jgi:hypothetical protein
MNKGLLNCNVSSGLFPQERAVSFKTAQGENVELFCPLTVLNGTNLIVTILEYSEDKVLVELPVESLNAGSVVLVNCDQVKQMVAA